MIHLIRILTRNGTVSIGCLPPSSPTPRKHQVKIQHLVDVDKIFQFKPAFHSYWSTFQLSLQNVSDQHAKALFNFFISFQEKEVRNSCRSGDECKPPAFETAGEVAEVGMNQHLEKTPHGIVPWQGNGCPSLRIISLLKQFRYNALCKCIYSQKFEPSETNKRLLCSFKKKKKIEAHIHECKRNIRSKDRQYKPF